MNKEAILAVADAIENRDIDILGFNMGDWLSQEGLRDVEAAGYRYCGTTACIAGWACFLDDPEVEVMDGKEPSVSYSSTAQYLLGLGENDADALFNGFGRIKGRCAPRYDKYEMLSSITAEQAVKTLRHFAETGDINWRL